MQTILRSVLLFIFALVLFLHSDAQTQKYWVSFKNKTNLSKQTIVNRTLLNIPLNQFSDVPITNEYLNVLKQMDVEVIARSKWLNAVTAYLTSGKAAEIAALPFVKSVEPVNVYLVASAKDIKVDPLLMHPALKQMKALKFSEAGIDATGIKIGVIDAGFFKLNEDGATRYLVAEDKIRAQRDFIDPSRKDLILTSATSSDDHGRQVVRMIAGYDTSNKAQYGMGTNASFYLARTENGDHEYRGEEDMWIMAMEWMDSLGIRLISTSLGYAIKMDDPNDNYVQSEMDGKTARITKAAQIAFEQKGIFLVVSAGNEGDSNWRIISAPADAQGALSVGATNAEVWDKIDYSSIGPEALPYLKPNVSCFSPNGTSFSCPAVAGFVACLMRYDSTLTNVQLKNIMERSAHLYPYGNNFIGYGIPQADRAMALTKNINTDFGTAHLVHCAKKKYILTLDKPITREAVVFHKKNETIVVNIPFYKRKIMYLLNQQTLLIKKGKLKIIKPKGVARTTVAVDANMTVEIIWE